MLNTPTPAFTPHDLATPADVQRARPRMCQACGAAPREGRVGLHGDGVVCRLVWWPVVDAKGCWTLVRTMSAARRYWCPGCGAVTTVAHPGVGVRTTFAQLAIAVLLRALVATPLGEGATPAQLFERVHGRELPTCERARAGVPRWPSLARWAGRLSVAWPAFVPPLGSWREQISAFVPFILATVRLQPWLEAAMSAHCRGGIAM